MLQKANGLPFVAPPLLPAQLGRTRHHRPGGRVWGERPEQRRPAGEPGCSDPPSPSTPGDVPSGSSPCCLLSSESFSLLILDSGSVCGPTLRKGFVGPSGFCSESSSAVQGVWRAEPRHSAWPALGKPHRNHCSSEACTQPECSECCVHGRIAFGALL